MGLLRGTDRRTEILERANAAFGVALREVPLENLWFLHAALEKRQVARVARGTWGGPEGLTCPLAALVCGAAPASDDEVREAAIRAEDLMRAHGYCARDFYGPWDAGLIPSWRLLRRVDGEITRRLVESGSRPAPTADTAV